jgi:hypothetical protein
MPMIVGKSLAEIPKSMLAMNRVATSAEGMQIPAIRIELDVKGCFRKRDRAAKVNSLWRLSARLHSNAY